MATPDAIQKGAGTPTPGDLEKITLPSPASPLAGPILAAIRTALITGEKLPETLDPFDLGVDGNTRQGRIFITLFQPGLRPLIGSSQRKGFTDSLNGAIGRLRRRPRYADFDPTSSQNCRILLEIIVREQTTTLEKMQDTLAFGPHRFEPGITGLTVKLKGETRHYPPTLAVIRGHRSLRQTLSHLAQQLNIPTQEELAEHPVAYTLLTSRAFVTYQEQALYLYRGLPSPPPLTPNALKYQLTQSGRWLLEHMQEDGRFLYYYHLGKDSERDHHFPNKPDFYNIVRHAGGVFGLLRYYERLQDPAYLKASRGALIYLEKQCRNHATTLGEGCYVYYNAKAKLGASGLTLVAMALYRRLSGDTSFDQTLHGLARHIISRIRPDGEFLGFYIHPRHNRGNPIIKTGPKLRKKLFSFFYPGEALLGLAYFVNWCEPDPKLAAAVRKGATKALDFLVHIRPERYQDLYSTIPSDAWYMQAIEAWWDDPEMRNPEWSKAALVDAQKMIEKMYKPGETPYPDYTGTYASRFGKLGTHYGSLGEGVVAAFHLAKKTGQRNLAQKIRQALRLQANALLSTFISPEAGYLCRQPDKGIGAIHFKINQRWTQVDAVQHTGCFYARYLPLLEKSSVVGKRRAQNKRAHSQP
ncbi:MAG: hypothetical protein HQL52_06475 [Magnetococcales bacterium]|nr:hypothetical protein [Magnetococcales bacterium]